jgi:predicted HicB family RNase H-like nuclease
MKEKARVELRMSEELKKRLQAEATMCEESLNTYCLMILRYRRKTKSVVPTREGRYLGY